MLKEYFAKIVRRFQPVPIKPRLEINIVKIMSGSVALEYIYSGGAVMKKKKEILAVGDLIIFNLEPVLEEEPC